MAGVTKPTWAYKYFISIKATSQTDIEMTKQYFYRIFNQPMNKKEKTSVKATKISIVLHICYLWYTYILFMIDIYTIYDIHIYYLWYAYVLFLMYIIYTIYDIHLYYLWYTYVLFLIYIYFIFDIHLYYLWYAYILFLIYIYTIYDTHMYYLWYAYILFMIWVWGGKITQDMSMRGKNLNNNCQTKGNKMCQTFQ